VRWVQKPRNALLRSGHRGAKVLIQGAASSGCGVTMAPHTRSDGFQHQAGDTAPDFEAETTAGRIKFHNPKGWKAPKPYIRIVPQPR
jgi:hypothetical protein